MRNKSKNNKFFSLQKQKETCENERREQFVRNSSHNGKKNKKYLDKSFYSLFFIVLDFIFYYLLTLIIMFINEIKYLIIIFFKIPIISWPPSYHNALPLLIPLQQNKNGLNLKYITKQVICV